MEMAYLHAHYSVLWGFMGQQGQYSVVAFYNWILK